MIKKERDLLMVSINIFYVLQTSQKPTSQISDQKLIESFKKVLPSLFWHGHHGFVKLSIELCADRFLRAVENKEQWTLCLWEIMSNVDEHVIKVGLKSCFTLLKVFFLLIHFVYNYYQLFPPVTCFRCFLLIFYQTEINELTLKAQ